MAKLASDLDNTDFVGATNPDSRLAVHFYKKALPHEFESQKQGRPIFYEVDFVRIQVPGDPTLAVDTPVREDHKQRFPLHWARYQNAHGGDVKEVGTPLDQWPALNKAQVEELRAQKFTTIESIATASDAQLQRIGMTAGMSPFAFRERAQRFLKVAHDDAVANQAEERNKALEKQLQDQAEAMKAMQEQLASLSQPKKRGRKPKAQEKVE